jgi:hypothetical protein
MPLIGEQWELSISLGSRPNHIKTIVGAYLTWRNPISIVHANVTCERRAMLCWLYGTLCVHLDAPTLRQHMVYPAHVS